MGQRINENWKSKNSGVLGTLFSHCKNYLYYKNRLDDKDDVWDC